MVSDISTDALDPEVVARLVTDQWKLIRSGERVVALLPGKEGQRFGAQIRFAERQLATFSEQIGFRIVTFEGRPFEAGLPASADNLEDFAEGEELIVASTIEPAIVRDMKVVMSGRVIVGRRADAVQGEQDVSRN